MDGTIYHENTLIPGTKEFFSLLVKQGKYYCFLTNNSSKGRASYVEKLLKLGIDVTEKNIVSSVSVTVSYLNQIKRHAKIYLVGTASLKRELENEGFVIVSSSYRKSDVDFVLVGFDTELNYSKIDGACYYISRNCKYLATNCDLRCPIIDNKYIPDCGAICKMIECATNRTPIYLGKPNREIVDYASNLWNVPLSKIICIGDRLYTDIAVGINAGISTAVVFTGETTPDDLKNSMFKPEFCFNSIADIYEILNNN